MSKNTSDIITFLDETISTNQYLKDLSQLEKLREGSSVFTDYQKGGKGCGANKWESEKGKNVLFSTIFFPDFIAATDQFILSEITALSILEILKEEVVEINPEAASKFSIKWPNDIYWEDKKISGILLENTISGRFIKQCIIGVGVNINQTDFPESLPNPVSLKQIIGAPVERRILFALILHNLHLYYLRLMKNEQQGIHETYMQNLYHKDGLHMYHSEEDGNFKASIKNIDPMGRLVLETEAGEEKIFLFKEVTFLS